MDASDWAACGELVPKHAIDCAPEDIRKEVWHQLKQRLNVGGATPLRDENVIGWFLDDDIKTREYVMGYAMDASGSTAPDCRLRELHELWVLAWWRWLGPRHHGRGVPWKAAVPGAQLIRRLAGAALCRLAGPVRH